MVRRFRCVVEIRGFVRRREFHHASVMSRRDAAADQPARPIDESLMAVASPFGRR